MLTNSSEHVYDDTDYSDNSYSITSHYNIVETHTVKIIDAPTIKYVGSVSNKFTIEIFDYSNTNVSSNYDITYEYGNIVVTKRPVIFKTKDLEKEYDGTVLTDTSHQLKEIPDLIKGHTYKIEGPFNEITNVGVVENTLTVIDILDSSKKSVIENYDIQYEYGNLTIHQRKITIESLSISKILASYSVCILTYSFHFSYTRDRYSPVLVSILITSPWFTNRGT